jgi:hypothetical protein
MSFRKVLAQFAKRCWAIEQALGCRAEACICSSREMNVLLDKPEERFQRSNRVFDSGMVLTN